MIETFVVKWPYLRLQKIQNPAYVSAAFFYLID
jgi:hypothetical protein